MKCNRYLFIVISFIFLFIIDSTAYADDIEEALKDAYSNGYHDGYRDGQNATGGGGGGTKAYGVGFYLPVGGKSKMLESVVPWVYQLDSSNKIMKFMDQNRAIEESPLVWRKVTKEILKQFKDYNLTTGIVVIENMPMNAFDKIGWFLENSRGVNIWLAPAK